MQLPLNSDNNFSPADIDGFKQELGGKTYLINEDEPNNDQVMHFFFLGNHKGKDAIYDAVAYTLLLAYDSKVYEIAEQEAQKQYPGFTPGSIDEETGEEIEAIGLTDEVEEFIAERMLALEEEDDIKVQENILIDDEFGGGIGLEVALKRESITPDVIEQFIKDYNAGQLKLDDTLYSFPGEEGDEEDYA